MHFATSIITLLGLIVLTLYGAWLLRTMIRPASSPVRRVAAIGAAFLSILGLGLLMVGGCYTLSSRACRPRLLTYALTHTLRTDLHGNATDALLGVPLLEQGGTAKMLGGSAVVLSVYTPNHVAIGEVAKEPTSIKIVDRMRTSLSWLVGFAATQ